MNRYTISAFWPRVARLIRRAERADFLFDDIVAELIWAPAMVLLIAGLVWGGSMAFSDNKILDEQSAAAAIVEHQTYQTAGSAATLYPTTTIDGRSNGSCQTPGSGWCSEKIVYSKAADGDHYQGWVVVPNATGGGSTVKHFTATGVDAADNAVGATVIDSTPFSVATPLAFGHVAASSLTTDPRNPAAATDLAYETKLGATPVDRGITWAANVIGNNGLEVVKVNVPELQTTTGMAIDTMPAANLEFLAVYATPTPLPTMCDPTAPSCAATPALVYAWPDLNMTGTTGQTAGPASFPVSMMLYHEPFFAEGPTSTADATSLASQCILPQPLYVPGTSTNYTATTDFGKVGKWVYPNPNPTSPPNSDSGPATFNVAQAAANFNPGQCYVQIYTVYTPRNIAQITSTEPTPFPLPVSVMGWLNLGYNGKTVTTLTDPLVLSGGGYTMANPGDTVSIAASKMEVSAAAGATAQTMPSGNLGSLVTFTPAACSSFLSATVSGQALSGAMLNRSWTGTLTFKVTGSGNQTGSTQACVATVTDAFNEPPIHVDFDVAQSVGDMSVWPSAEEMALTGSLGTDSAGAACPAFAYKDAPGGTLDRNDTAPLSNGGKIVAQTDASGCILNAAGNPVTGAAVAYQPSGTGTFSTAGGCLKVVSPNNWVPNASGQEPGAERLGLTPFATGSCSLTLAGQTGGGKANGTTLIGVVDTNGCVNGKACYLEYDGTWNDYSHCVNKNKGENCDGEATAQDIYMSTNGGVSWNFYFQELVLDSVKGCIPAANIPNVTISYYDRMENITPLTPTIGTTGLPINGNTGDPPTPTPPACTIFIP